MSSFEALLLQDADAYASQAPSIATIQQAQSTIQSTLSKYDATVTLAGSALNGTGALRSDVDLSIQKAPLLYRADERRQLRESDYEEWVDWHGLVLDALGKNFDVMGKNKCIEIIGGASLHLIDALPCLIGTDSFEDLVTAEAVIDPETIAFWTIHDTPPVHIRSHPKLHQQHGEEKNRETDGRYKQLVRVLKTMRGVLADDKELDPNTARSHHLECAAYNVPSEVFLEGLPAALTNITKQVLETDPSGLITVSHRYKLFGEGATQWTIGDAKNFFRAVNGHLARRDLDVAA